MARKRSKVRSSRRASSKRRNNRNKRSSRLRKALESLPETSAELLEPGRKLIQQPTRRSWRSATSVFPSSRPRSQTLPRQLRQQRR